MLIFDFDGTLADTHSLIIEISNILSDEFKYRKIGPHEVDKLRNKSSQQIIRHLKVPVFKIPSILAKAKKTFFENIGQVRPFDGIKEVLKALHEKKVPMGILSSNSRQNIEHFLKTHDLNYFRIIYSTPKIWSKNTSLQRMIEENKLDMNDVIYVGDELRDIEAAKKIGIKIASVTWGYNSKEILMRRRPDYMFTQPRDLLKLSTKQKD